MKLAACYTVYNGLELLDDSIDQIKDQVDEVIICWQIFSNYGDRCEKIYDQVKEWRKKYTVIEFIPNFTKDSKTNEKVKHQRLIDKAKELDCTHFFLSATDHFYKPSETEYAKKFMIDNPQVKTTYTKMATYFKTTKMRLYPLEPYFMPFICSTSVSMGNKAPVIVDPACMFHPFNPSYVFKESEVLMHHYSWLRLDIRNKLENAAAKVNWNNRIDEFVDKYENFKIGDSFPYYPNHNIIECKEEFNLHNF
jgi:hypothetical protein